MTSPLSPEEALIYIMVTMSAVDRDMNDAELKKIGNIVQKLPVFENYDTDRLVETSSACGRALRKDEGLNGVLESVKQALPPHLVETAYALAVEVAAADLSLQKEELRLLQIFRVGLGVDLLNAAAIERGAHARHAVLGK